MLSSDISEEQVRGTSCEPCAFPLCRSESSSKDGKGTRAESQARPNRETSFRFHRLCYQKAFLARHFSSRAQIDDVEVLG